MGIDPEGADGGHQRDIVVALTPFGLPQADLVVAVERAGSLGMLDLGLDPVAGRNAADALAGTFEGPFGVRICGPRWYERDTPAVELPESVDTVVVAPSARLLCSAPADKDHPIAAFIQSLRLMQSPRTTSDSGTPTNGSVRSTRIWVEVCSLPEAQTAVACGADGLLAKGSESGGRIAEETAFVLLQRLVGAVGIPIWLAGGIGRHTAAAAVAGGAAGVVIDSQLALVRECHLSHEITAAVRAMDGSETAVVAGHRVYSRPDLAVAHLTDHPSGSLSPDDVASRLGGSDLHRQFLPVGQDGAFAARLAARWPTAGSLVRGIARSISEHVESAIALDPLAPKTPWALQHNLEYPIAQGPMTRVSDRAEFALEVAEAGGLPFLALALMTGRESERLLRHVAAVMGDRTWGVGILGFVPPEVRQAQLEVIHDIKPPVALIAGGRPSQARPLEEAGITTYLHVPSAGLLDRFIRDGARRFVFEGRECGGHVGPRSSFALWDVQIETLLGSHVAGECSVLFAGGVHDGRSAAMVAAMAAPLAAGGCKIGVLMGTAYLFTQEAVSAGAILSGFQEQAISCDDTVLLETSPGHATRCADTDYVRTFAAERAHLESEGFDTKEVWARLENLNLGRLRIASKGLVRTAGELTQVDEAAQKADGMYMLGQVGALRSDTLTVADLHHQVSVGSSTFLAALSGKSRQMAKVHSRPAPPPAQVAIVGMAGVFPGAHDVEEFWSNIVAGKDLVTEVPESRWDVERYYDPAAVGQGAGRKTPSRWGGFIPDIAFDALGFGIPPKSLAAIEPVQLLALHVAAQAMADAGYGSGSSRDLDRSRVSVVFGAESGTDLSAAYGFRSLAPQLLGGLPADLEELLPVLTEDSFPGLLSNVIAGRIANRLDLGGLNFTVDAACASSLAAVDVGIKELVIGTSDMVLCGGADLHNAISDYLLFASVHALSAKGRCASFDSDADGIVLGEGVACVVLKRLEDAERDGDRIYAVIDAMAGSSDGRSLGLIAPRAQGQRAALDRAYAQARYSPASLGLLEGHGTGTVVGDRTELGVLEEAFTQAGADPATCALGSVKSQIGHTKCAAGLAGLIKVARALHHGVLPPTIHIEHPNPGYDSETSPFAFHAEARPWPARTRRAALSAFGFGGTNFHAVLSSYSPDAGDPKAGFSPEHVAGDAVAGVSVAAGTAGGASTHHGLCHWPVELLLVRGEDRAAAEAMLRRLVRLLESIPKASGESPAAAAVPTDMLRNLVWTAWREGTGPVQAAAVISDLDQLHRAVDRLLQLVDDPLSAGAQGEGLFVRPAAVEEEIDPVTGGSVAFMFPGQGSQKPGMLAPVFVAFPELHRHLRNGSQWLGEIYPPAAFDADTRRRQMTNLTDTRVAQPALGVTGMAVADLLKRLGVQPEAVAGHSYGEVVALAVAGVIGDQDLLPLSSQRAVAISMAGGEEPGSMAAVSGDAASVASVLPDTVRVVVANDNSPSQVVISGTTLEVETAMATLSSAGLANKKIPVSCAFHSPVVAGAEPVFAQCLAAVEISSPEIQVWSNTIAAPYPTGSDEIRALLASQLVKPVRFREQVQAMYNAGSRIFVEAGPGKVLTGLVGKILGDRPHLAVAVDGSGHGDLRGLLLALAELAVAGVDLDPTYLFDGRAKPVDLDQPMPPSPKWVVNGHLVRTMDGSPVKGGLRPADQMLPEAGYVRASLRQAGVFSGAVGGHHAGSVAHQPIGISSGSPYTSAADRPLDSQHVTTSGGGVASADGTREAAVVEYIRALREAIAAGREVTLGLLGIEPTFQTQLVSGPFVQGVTAALAPAASYSELYPEEQGQGHHGAPASDHASANGNDPSHLVVDAAQPGVSSGVSGASGESVARWALLSGEDLRRIVVGVVSERTGYPPEMLDPSLDLEADLSIDSIKRLEIVGELAEKVGLVGGHSVAENEAVVEELVAVKTLAGVVSWLERAFAVLGQSQEAVPSITVGGDVSSGDGDPGAESGGNGAEAEATRPVPLRALRFVPRLVELPALGRPSGRQWAERSLLIVDDGEGVAKALAEILEAEGASASVVPAERFAESLAGAGAAAVIDLGPLDLSSGEGPVEVFTRTRQATEAGVRTVMVVSALDGHLGFGNLVSVNAAAGPAAGMGVPGGKGVANANGAGSRQGARETGRDRGANGTGIDQSTGEVPRFLGQLGLRGLVKTAALEMPDRCIRLVDVDPDAPVVEVAQLLAAELSSDEHVVEVGLAHGKRATVAVVDSEISGAGHDETGAGHDESTLTAAPSGADSLDWGPGGVLVVTGGARGVTARIAEEIVRLTHCHVVICGRTVEPGTEEGSTTGETPVAMSIRKALAGAKFGAPAQIEAETRRLLAEREVRSNLARLAEEAESVTYRQLDVRDTKAVAAMIAETYERFGRIDGVVHGAGVVEDARFADKTSESFRRVYETKVVGATALLTSLHSDLRLLVFFGSVSGLFGNRGQVDYAAANDALATISRWAGAHMSGRVVTFDWGPWGGGGMVSPELEREFNRRGVGLLDPDDACGRLVSDVRSGATDAEVVIMRSRPEPFLSAADTDGHHRAAHRARTRSGAGAG